jgi:hypothetical protein
MGTRPAPSRPAGSRLQRYRIERIYADGWAAQKVRLYLPYLLEMKAVRIEGLSHHLSYPLAIRMSINGRRTHKLSIAGPGRFALVGEYIEAPRTVPEVEIEFFAEQDFAPTEVESSPDTHRLAYRIEKLSLICVNNADIPLYSVSAVS